MFYKHSNMKCRIFKNLEKTEDISNIEIRNDIINPQKHKP